MFNYILQASQRAQNEQESSAAINILAGLNLIGKVFVTTHQWNNEFAKIQSSHGSKHIKPSEEFDSKNDEKQNSFTAKIAESIQNFSLKECQLCKKQQSTQNFKLMCKCDHKFCYSCLNAYAISKINGQERVICPDPICPSEMKLSSDVYKNLPEVIKLKYLQWKNINKAKQLDISDSCTRCLEKRHSGPCKVAFSKENIESAFKFRKCYKCQTQAVITTGIKKVCCQSCKAVFCYLCGQAWPIEGQHSCLNDEKIFVLEQELQESAAVTDKNQYICEDSECMCFKNTGKCFNHCFYCKKCDFGICLGNFILMPIRFVGSLIVVVFYLLIFILVIISLFGWFLTGIITGVTCYSCELLGQLNGSLQVIAIIGFPFFMMVGIFMALKNTFKGFLSTIKVIFDFYQSAMCELWILCGPKQCCT